MGKKQLLIYMKDQALCLPGYSSGFACPTTSM